MRQELQDRADWRDCDAGAIQQLGNRLRRRRRARRVQYWTVAGMSMAGFAFVALLWASGSWRPSANPSLACRDVARMADRYVEGTLTAETMNSIARHLDACPKCEHYVERLRDDRTDTPSEAESRADRLRNWLQQPAVASL